MWGSVVTGLVAAGLLVPAVAWSVPHVGTSGRGATTAESEALVTWWHSNGDQRADGPVADDAVRQSPHYAVQVATTDEPEARYDSFTYMSIPRSGKGKIGYDSTDGAEFADEIDQTMSWSSFEYADDVWVDVTLRAGSELSSVDEVTIRPTSLGLEAELVDPTTVRVKVPYVEGGLRFSVEVDPELVTAYNDLTGVSGRLTTDPSGAFVHTEPRNALLVFAQPMLTGRERAELVPDPSDDGVLEITPGRVGDLNHVDAEVLYFGPGTYFMGSDYHALLPQDVRWVYLAPGAYVKGAFRFLHETQPDLRVTGYGVLSGEQYVYEADTENGYTHLDPDKGNCHSSCVKMLQFASSPRPQHLTLQGVTINEPPYHSFVVYGDEATFAMDVRNYQQVGSWYWQTDGIELYDGSAMEHTFFHSNDDVLKIYHSDVTVDDTVIWKVENGPVIQWGWSPRTIDDVEVSNTSVIHNRMAWMDEKYNTCILNSSSHWEDMGATDRGNTRTSITNVRFSGIRVEGATSCAIRVSALSNTSHVVVEDLAIDAWNDLPLSGQVSRLTAQTEGSGAAVVIGDQMTEDAGILLHHYTVGGETITKDGGNWADVELGRLGFDGALWENWDATGG